MKIKRFGVALLACVMCFGAFSTTAFAYVDENASKRRTCWQRKRSLRQSQHQKQ